MIEGKTVACMATYPGRYSTLDVVLSSIAPQLDQVLVYVNGPRDGLPDESKWGNVRYHFAADEAGDLSANGKVYLLRYVRDCLVFTLDDDFLYPPDFVQRFKDGFAILGPRCCLVAHGSVFPPRPRWYYERTKVYGSLQGHENYQLVTLGGSGLFAFHSKHLPIDFDRDFAPLLMADLKMSLSARYAGLPIFSIPREKGWLQLVVREGLWHQFKERVTHHTFEARKHDFSFTHYATIVRDWLDGEHGGVAPEGIDASLLHGVSDGREPRDWCVGPLLLKKRIEYLKLLSQT